MQLKTIKLSYRIKLANEEDAKVLNVVKPYKNYFDVIKDTARYRDITNSATTPVYLLKELEEMLVKSETSSFLYCVKNASPFQDVSKMYAFEVNDIRLKLRAFNIQLNVLELDIFCITDELNLIETIGTFVVIEKNTNEGEWIKTVTVALTADTTIHEIKANTLNR